MSDGGEAWEFEYHETEAGKSPISEWLKEMGEGGGQALALGYIDQLARLGSEARRPLVRQLEGKLTNGAGRPRATSAV